MEKLFAKKRSEVINPKDVMHMDLRRYNQMHRYDSVDEYLASYSNLYRKLIEAVDRKGLPKFFFSTGTEDPLMAENFVALRDRLTDLGFEAVWVEGPGTHEWRVWERDIQLAFDFFGLNGKEKGNAF
jgi:S-formylglutathione hydrolase FrmB